MLRSFKKCRCASSSLVKKKKKREKEIREKAQQGEKHAEDHHHTHCAVYYTEMRKLLVGRMECVPFLSLSHCAELVAFGSQRVMTLTNDLFRIVHQKYIGPFSLVSMFFFIRDWSSTRQNSSRERGKKNVFIHSCLFFLLGPSLAVVEGPSVMTIKTAKTSTIKYLKKKKNFIFYFW